MAYGLIRVREVGRGGIADMQLHNNREYEVKGLPTPDNIRVLDNQTEANGSMLSSGKSITEAINNRLKEAEVKERKNSVVALEFVIGASPDFYKHIAEYEYIKESLSWLEERYGAENVVAVNMHVDESTPHAHFIVTPIVEKEVKWKNEKGEGSKIENRLAARDLTGTKKHLIALQDDFFKYVSEKYNPILPPYCQFVRGKSAMEENKKYTKHTSAELGVLKNDVDFLKSSMVEIKKFALSGLISFENAIEKTKVIVEKLEIKEKEIKVVDAKIQNAEKVVLKIEKRQDFNKNGKWKKGKDFKPGF